MKNKTALSETDILEKMLDNTDAQLAYLDLRFNFIKVNAAYAKGSGYRKSDLIGKNHFDLFSNGENQKIFEKVRKTGRPVKFRARPFVYANRPQKVTYWDWTLKPVKDGNRQLCGFVLSLIDVTERRELEFRKDEFISIASHELKTPLTSIKAYNQILEKIIKEIGDRRAKLYIERTGRYIDELSSLITDLLDVSKIQSGKLQFNLSRFDFDELVENSAEEAQLTANRHAIVVSGKIRQKIVGDRHRLQQVMNNLLNNAVKYSPGKDKVIIRVGKTDRFVKVAIKDYGIGIPKIKQKKIFERFYRVDTTAQHFSGLGIGLYISAEIVRRHGGKIWVVSKQGYGSTFYFTLPFGLAKI